MKKLFVWNSLLEDAGVVLVIADSKPKAIESVVRQLSEHMPDSHRKIQYMADLKKTAKKDKCLVITLEEDAIAIVHGEDWRV